MASIGLNDVYLINCVQSVLGETGNAVAQLNTSDCINQWSFWSPSSLCIDPTTKCFCCGTDVVPYKQGDFRCYVSTASEPCVCDYNLCYPEGDTSATICFPIFPNETNFMDADSGSGSLTYYWVKVWSDTGKTGLIECVCSAVTYVCWGTIPVCHTKAEAGYTCRACSPQLLNLTFDPRPWDGCNLYVETWMGTAGAQCCARFPDYESYICVTELQQPCVSVFTVPATIPAGWTAVFWCITDQNMFNGDTSWDFQGCLMGISGATTYDLDGVVCLCYTYDATCYFISEETMTCQDTNFVNDPLAAGDVLNYGDCCTVNMHINCLTGCYPV